MSDFLGPSICDTCLQPFKDGDVVWQADDEPDWCFHASDCPGPPDVNSLAEELAYKAEAKLMERLWPDIYGTAEEIESEQRAKATAAPSTNRQSGCSNEMTTEGNIE